MDCGRLASASEFNLRQVGQVGTPAVQTFWLYLSNFQKNKGGIPPLTIAHIFLLHRTVDKAPRTSPLVIEAAGERYRQAGQFLYLGGLVNARADITPETKLRVRLAWACCIDSGGRCTKCPAHSAGAHAGGRGDGDPAVRTCNVDPRQGALR